MSLHEEVEYLKKIVFEQATIIEELKIRLGRYEHPKNSNNSSIPPSKDENRPNRNQSLREKSGKKLGGQKGHKGSTLTFIEVPDRIEKIIPD